MTLKTKEEKKNLLTTAAAVDFVKKHIESFPTMEPHYIRKTSKRLYLDALLSIAKMYLVITKMTLQFQKSRTDFFVIITTTAFLYQRKISA